ncbi:site-specific integrase [Thermodesulfobacteriota bacterium]
MTINIEDSKTGKGNVPISDCLRSVLAERLEDHKHYYLFCDKYGNPFKSINKSFKAALKRADIENFRFHDLRHTFASHLAMNGYGGITLQKLGRWKTPSMVMRYAHLSEPYKKSAVDTLAGLFEGKGESSSASLAIL